MLKVENFKSQELIASFFKENQHDIDWELVCGFFSQLFATYQISDIGSPLYKQIMSDWDLMTDEDSAQNVLTEVCARSELSTYKFRADSKVVYRDIVSSAQASWQQLKDNIKTDTRFLVDIKELENSGLKTCIADSIDTYKSSNAPKLYRARIMNKDDIPFKCNQMGMPPASLASAGRANPVGIPYLYACFEPSTCCYEVRAAYLDRVAIGTFVVKEGKELKLANLDLCNNSQQLSTDSEPATILRNRILLNAIGKDLSTPMRRHDDPLIEYLPTQFICEYIRKNYDVDGIVFQSSIDEEGRNVVLFNTDKVKCIDVKEWDVNKIKINVALTKHAE